MNEAQCKSLWTEIVKKLEPLVQRAMLITWFKDTAVLGKEDGTLIIGLSYPMFLNWHLEHYKECTLKVAKELDPSIDRIVYNVDISLQKNDPRAIDILALFPSVKPRKLPKKQEVKVAEGLVSKMLNPSYTLDRFVVGSNNRLAHAACLAVSSDPGGKYNPLFVYGGVGLGKTHLLQAVGNEVLRSRPNTTVLYTTSEEFTNQVIEGIKFQKMEQIRKRYRQVDLLMIDDIQFFAGKERSQEEFFHTFNTLLEAGKQVVISSDRPPQELHNTLQPRLRSRFERGMVADVKAPDFETRVAILTERAQEYGLLLENSVITYVAEQVQDSVRCLEGILMQIVAQYELEHRMPTIGSITEILQKLSRDSASTEEEVIGFETAPKRAPQFEDILQSVSSFYSVSIQDMVGNSRTRTILVARQVAMYITQKHLRMSLTSVGERFSGRDHSTVINSVKKIDKLLQKDPQLLREVRAIEQEVGVAS